MRPLLHSLVVLAAWLSAPLLSAGDAGPVDPAVYDRPVRLACVGDSITEGVGAEQGRSWPDQIRALLGDRWTVGNFGVSATTLMNSGNKPYQEDPAFKKALAFKPDVVVIMLGTNDTKANNWKHFGEDFEKDYRDLIGDFATLETKPRIYLCLPPYIARDGLFGINEPNTRAQIPVVTKIARDLGLGLIDIHGTLAGKDELIPDNVHPNSEGAGLIAKAVHTALTGKPVPVPAETK